MHNITYIIHPLRRAVTRRATIERNIIPIPAWSVIATLNDRNYTIAIVRPNNRTIVTDNNGYIVISVTGTKHRRRRLVHATMTDDKISSQR